MEWPGSTQCYDSTAQRPWQDQHASSLTTTAGREWHGLGGNLPVNWHKLLGPFQNVFTTLHMCMYSECHFTSFLVQKSKILFFYCVLVQFNAVEST